MFGVDKVKRLTKKRMQEISEGWDDGFNQRMTVVAIPLHYSEREIQNQVAVAVEPALRKRRAGQRKVLESRARYPIHRHFKASDIRRTLEAYDQRQKGLKNYQIADTYRELAAKDVKGGEHNFGEGRDSWVYLKDAEDPLYARKRSLETKGVRQWKLGEVLIAGAEKGIFPASAPKKR